GRMSKSPGCNSPQQHCAYCCHGKLGLRPAPILIQYFPKFRFPPLSLSRSLPLSLSPPLSLSLCLCLCLFPSVPLSSSLSSLFCIPSSQPCLFLPTLSISIC